MISVVLRFVNRTGMRRKDGKGSRTKEKTAGLGIDNICWIAIMIKGISLQ